MRTNNHDPETPYKKVAQSQIHVVENTRASMSSQRQLQTKERLLYQIGRVCVAHSTLVHIACMSKFALRPVPSHIRAHTHAIKKPASLPFHAHA
jgi:hypothetical protein